MWNHRTWLQGRVLSFCSHSWHVHLSHGGGRSGNYLLHFGEYSINPFMLEGLLDRCRLDLRYFQNQKSIRLPITLPIFKT